MTPTLRLATGLAAMVLAAPLPAATPALAQAPAATAPASPAPARPTRLRGTIAAVEGDVLRVTTREGPVVAVALGPNLSVSALRRVDPDTIAPGTYVGAAAEPDADGQLVARSLVVFPEAMRGTAEGQFPWDLTPASSMTNATVSAVVAGRSGRDLELRWGQDRSGTIRIAADTPVVTPVPATRADLVPGAAVFLSATPGEGGVPTTSRVTVAKDGVAPPM